MTYVCGSCAKMMLGSGKFNSLGPGDAPDKQGNCDNCGKVWPILIPLRPSLSRPEPPPTTNSSKPIWELVIADMRERDREGRKKYGTPLQAFNGRDALVDCYQEALDLAVYLCQAIEERRQTGATKEIPTTHEGSTGGR
jgi:hypothetical protein